MDNSHCHRVFCSRVCLVAKSKEDVTATGQLTGMVVLGITTSHFCTTEDKMMIITQNVHLWKSDKLIKFHLATIKFACKNEDSVTSTGQLTGVVILGLNGKLSKKSLKMLVWLLIITK